MMNISDSLLSYIFSRNDNKNHNDNNNNNANNDNNKDNDLSVALFLYNSVIKLVIDWTLYTYKISFLSI